MKIVFPTHHFPTPDEAGAPRPWQLARHFSKMGHEIYVIVAAYDYMSGKRAKSKSNFKLWKKDDVDLQNVTCIKTWALPNYKDSIARRIVAYSSYSVLSFLSSLPLPKIDVVYAPNNPPTNSMFGYLLAKLKGGKFIEEIREPHPEMDIALGYFEKGLLRRIYEKYHKFFHERSDLIVSLTPGITRILTRKNVPRSKILEIPNAYDQENDNLLLRFSKEEAKEKVGWQNKFTVLYAGSHGLVPKLQTLLEAAKILRQRKNIQFVLMGSGDYKERYVQFAEKHRLENCIFIPGKPRKEMPLYYRASDICTHLIPKGELWKCILPNKVFDYLGSGKPVIFSGEGDTADLLDKAEAGVAGEPENPQVFAKAVLQLMDDPKKCSEMGENGRKYVLSHYKRSDLMAELEKALQKIV